MAPATIRGIPGKWFLETKNGVQHVRRHGKAALKTDFIIKPNPDNIHIQDNEDTIVLESFQELGELLKRKQAIHKMLKTMK